MLFNAGLALLSLASVASAQMTVQVGFTSADPGGIFQFKPNNFKAPNGTVVTFQFIGAPGNHTVTQSLFTDPCNPAPGGFDSGWVFIPSPVSQVPEWNLTITNDAKPIWFFCKQLLPSPHCAAGMVGAINAPATGNTFAAFQSAAMSAGQKGSGQSQGGLVGIGASASAGVGPIPSGVTAYTGVIAAATGAAGNGSASASATSPASSSTASSASGAEKVVGGVVGAFGAAVLGLMMA